MSGRTGGGGGGGGVQKFFEANQAPLKKNQPNQIKSLKCVKGKTTDQRDPKAKETEEGGEEKGTNGRGVGLGHEDGAMVVDGRRARGVEEGEAEGEGVETRR